MEQKAITLFFSGALQSFLSKFSVSLDVSSVYTRADIQALFNFVSGKTNNVWCERL